MSAIKKKTLDGNLKKIQIAGVAPESGAMGLEKPIITGRITALAKSIGGFVVSTNPFSPWRGGCECNSRKANKQRQFPVLLVFNTPPPGGREKPSVGVHQRNTEASMHGTHTIHPPIQERLEDANQLLDSVSCTMSMAIPMLRLCIESLDDANHGLGNDPALSALYGVAELLGNAFEKLGHR